jgi:hypothetical protein
MERFFGSLKSEWVPEGGYNSEHEARADINRYVARYNNVRRHSFNGYHSPVAAEKWPRENRKECPKLLDQFICGSSAPTDLCGGAGNCHSYRDRLR